jgi:hypothetical protein
LEVVRDEGHLDIVARGHVMKIGIEVLDHPSLTRVLLAIAFRRER